MTSQRAKRKSKRKSSRRKSPKVGASHKTIDLIARNKQQADMMVEFNKVLRDNDEVGLIRTVTTNTIVKNIQTLPKQGIYKGNPAGWRERALKDRQYLLKMAAEARELMQSQSMSCLATTKKLRKLSRKFPRK